MRKFDLNIEQILESWETYHAVREVLANALDEHLLTRSDKKVQIDKEDGVWIIRDFGRGLQYTHLTQNESDEKHQNPHVIGMFGIGLKDALATFKRRGIDVQIESKFAGITTDWAPKEGFSDVSTLHALVYSPADPEFIGTKFVLKRLKDEDMARAKALFLQFSGAAILDTTVKGQVIVRQGDTGIIYVNGVQVAEEPNFLFSYNITALSAGLRKAMNRERSNVGRSAYTDLIKKILLESKSPKVSAAIAKNLKDLSNGTQRDELNWVDVQRHAVKILNTTGQYLFISAEDAMDHPDTIDHARAAGLDILILPEQLAQGLGNMRDQVGNPIRDLGEFVEEYNRSFQFSFIAPEHLTQSEQSVHALTSKIVVLFGGKPKQVKDIRISETMRQDLGNDATTQGCWDPQSQCIVISRRTLGSMAGYAGVLVHELIHARSGYSDVTRDFENALTDAIGRAYERLLPERGESVSVPISGVAEPKQGITILGKARRWWNGN